MIIIYYSLIAIFSAALFWIFVYVKNNISILGNGQQKVITILLLLIILNIIIMLGVFTFNNYISQYRLIGDIGMQGEMGPRGEIGPIKCPTKK
jgi:hypothetical protein